MSPARPPSARDLASDAASATRLMRCLSGDLGQLDDGDDEFCLLLPCISDFKKSRLMAMRVVRKWARYAWSIMPAHHDYRASGD